MVTLTYRCKKKKNLLYTTQSSSYNEAELEFKLSLNMPVIGGKASREPLVVQAPPVSSPLKMRGVWMWLMDVRHNMPQLYSKAAWIK